MKKFLMLFLFMATTACSTMPKSTLDHSPPKELQEAAAKNLKQYVVFDPKNLYRPPGSVSSMSATFKAVMAKEMGGKLLREIPNTNAFVVQSPAEIKNVPGGNLVIQEERIYHTMETLYRHVPVETTIPTCPACPVCPGPVDPGPGPGPIVNTTWGQRAVHAAEASALATAENIIVCIIDTGLDRSVHSQFPAGMLLPGESMVSGEAWDVDPARHGTHTSGTVGSAKYGNARVKVLQIKVLGNSGSGSGSWIAGGISRCRARGANVISASLGMDRGTDPLMSAAIDQYVAAGGIFVAAAGNSSGGPIGFPANKSNVIAVTSMDEQGRLSSFSSKGSKAGEMVIAPGSNILSLCPNGTCTMSGTSMATPHVAAIVALALAKGKRTIGVVNKGLAPTEQGRGQADALETVRGTSSLKIKKSKGKKYAKNSTLKAA